MTTPTDPAAMFREMLGQWEKMTNSVGGDMMRSAEFAKGMHGANTGAMAGQEAMNAFMQRALAAANMPSREEIADLSARLGRLEDAIARIETAIVPPAPSNRPKPARTRRPPAKA